jgi:hypothetical protein
MKGIAPLNVTGADLAVRREVALAYRRTFRLAQRTTDYVPDYERLARDAADAQYVASRPETATLTRLERSESIALIIASAINANPVWFWHGSDR